MVSSLQNGERASVMSDVPPELIDANGRPYRFHQLFGGERSHRLLQRPLREPVDKSRLDGCLKQLVKPKLTRFGERYGAEQNESKSEVLGTGKRDTETKVPKKNRFQSRYESQVSPGQGDPWENVDLTIMEKLLDEVSYRTKIDCGLPLDNEVILQTNGDTLRLQYIS